LDKQILILLNYFHQPYFGLVFLVVPPDFYRGVIFCEVYDYVTSFGNSNHLFLRRTLVRFVFLFNLVHPLSIFVDSRTSDPRQREILQLTLFEINECILSPAGGGSSSMKMNFQLGVDKEDVKW